MLEGTAIDSDGSGSYVAAVPRRSKAHGKQRAVTTPVHSAEEANDSDAIEHAVKSPAKIVLKE